MTLSRTRCSFSCCRRALSWRYCPFTRLKFRSYLWLNSDSFTCARSFGGGMSAFCFSVMMSKGVLSGAMNFNPDFRSCREHSSAWAHRRGNGRCDTTATLPPRVAFRRVVVSLRGPGQSPVRPSACCVGSLRSVGRCGRCSCRCRFRVRGAQSLPPRTPSPVSSGQ